MTISDTNSERRNLTLYSIFIVIFYLLEAELTDSVLRLQIINISIHNAGSIKYIVTIGLIWFLYRYWITNEGSWKENYREYIDSDCGEFIYYRYLMKKFGLNDNYSKALMINKHHVKMQISDDVIYFKHVYNKSGRRYIGGDQETKTIRSGTLTDKWYICLRVVYLFFRKPALSNYFIPYFLFVIALFLLIKNF